MIDKKLSTQQRVEKIVELFSQIEKISFGTTSLNMHDVPILALDDKWKVDIHFMDGGKRNYFVATPKNRGIPNFGITFFGIDSENEGENE